MANKNKGQFVGVVVEIIFGFCSFSAFCSYFAVNKTKVNN